MAYRALGLKVSDHYCSIRSDFIDGDDWRKIRYRLKCLFTVLPTNVLDQGAGLPIALKLPTEDPAVVYDALFGEPTDGAPSLEDMVAKLPVPDKQRDRLPEPLVIKNRLMGRIQWQYMLDAMRDDFATT